MDWIKHWILADFYSPVWPNVAAQILFMVPLLRRHHKRVMRKTEAMIKQQLAIHRRIERMQKTSNVPQQVNRDGSPL